jgi:hypothetical protein
MHIQLGMHILLDNCHLFVVQCIMHGHQVVIGLFHMPKRSQIEPYSTASFFEETQTLAPYGQAIIVCLGDWGRFFPWS